MILTKSENQSNVHDWLHWLYCLQPWCISSYLNSLSRNFCHRKLQSLYVFSYYFSFSPCTCLSSHKTDLIFDFQMTWRPRPLHQVTTHFLPKTIPTSFLRSTIIRFRVLVRMIVKKNYKLRQGQLMWLVVQTTRQMKLVVEMFYNYQVSMSVQKNCQILRISFDICLFICRNIFSVFLIRRLCPTVDMSVDFGKLLRKRSITSRVSGIIWRRI